MNGQRGGTTSHPHLLVTTALEETWGTGEPLVFLGEWCRIYDRRHVWTERSHHVVRNHWDDRRKLREDHAYLNRLHDSVLTDLVTAMNRYHGIDRPVRYWQTILDPWLLTYVAVIWDRWECLRLAFADHEQLETLALAQTSDDPGCLNYADFIEKATGDRWNHGLCHRIIQSEHSRQCHVTPSATEPAAPPVGALTSPGRHRRRSLKHRAAALVDRALGRLSNGNGVVFYDTYLPPAILMRLNRTLRQLPRWYLDEFDWRQVADDAAPFIAQASRGADLALSLTPANNFEAFLFGGIAKDLPAMYVEGLPLLIEKANRLGMKPRVILTANAHWWNDLFKVWCAERVLHGTKLVAMEHGGCLPLAFSTMSFEEDIADAKTTWAVPVHPKQHQLPASQLCDRKVESTREYLAVVGMDTYRYNVRAEAGPKAGQLATHTEAVCALYERLTEDVRAKCLIKPYPHGGWNTCQQFVDRLGADKVSPEPSYRRFLSRARLTVCTYPQTTFAESMASGLPSILCYPVDLWELHPAFEPMIDGLRRAKIVFHDSAAAAHHINEIWHEPESWWNRHEVLAARAEFHRQVLAVDSDWLQQWTTYIEAVVA